jgi:hypothetical protein
MATTRTPNDHLPLTPAVFHIEPEASRISST